MIQILGQHELEKHINKGGKVYSHLISIGNPGKGRKNRPDHILPKLFKQTFKSILRLEFYDVESKSHLVKGQKKRIPQKRDVKKIIRYYNKTKNRATGYTIHCWRGIARSTAVGLIILYLMYKDEQKAAQKLAKIRRQAMPHKGMIEHFDNIMGTNLSNSREKLWKERIEIIRKELEEDLIEELEVVE
ncbi:MAG: hypothetical protein ACOCUI_01200 [bacterium]